MNLSMKWLREFVDIGDMSPRDFSEAMTMSGSKVEGYEIKGDNINKIVVCKILEIAKHPDAERLSVCSVDIGAADPIQIVTNATNIKPGDLVPVALDKALLSDGTKIKKGKLRGVLSQGMFCSFNEIGISKDIFENASEDGVLVLEEEYPVGQDIRDALGINDVVVEFEITPNRPDCLSVIGLAREAAATFDKPLNLHTPVIKAGNEKSSDFISVKVLEPDLCPNYSARVVKNVKIKKSPKWLRERLISAGIRPINNIVDITNYLLTEYGQPMHAFDLSMIKDGNIIVRKANNGEKVKTLDEVERSLNEDNLVIADSEKVLAIAGVMGAEFSGITDETKTIVFESANFNASSVRLTAKSLGMRTDASSKYEKSLDPQNCIPALDRACELIELLGAGDVMDESVTVDNSNKVATKIHLDVSWINSFLSTDISGSNMISILKKIGCTMDGEEIVVPSYRQDLINKADIAEEIARFYGYNNIEVSNLNGSTEGKYSPEQKFEQKLCNAMTALGLNEVITYSFISPKYYDKICMPKDHTLRKSVVISNPLGEDTSIMRTTCIPSMVEVLSKNYNNRNSSAHLFEIAKEYQPTTEDKLPIETKKLVAGFYGKDVDFLVVKGIVEDVFANLDICDYEIEANTKEFAFHPGRCADIIIANSVSGVIGEIHPSVLENYDMDTRAYVAVIDVNDMFNNINTNKVYKPLPKHPATARDLALICDDNITIGSLEKTIRSAAGDLLEKITLFDVYKGEQIQNGKKSVAFNIVLRAKDNTLTDDQTNKVIENVMNSLEKTGVTLRS